AFHIPRGEPAAVRRQVDPANPLMAALEAPPKMPAVIVPQPHGSVQVAGPDPARVRRTADGAEAQALEAREVDLTWGRPVEVPQEVRPPILAKRTRVRGWSGRQDTDAAEVVVQHLEFEGVPEAFPGAREHPVREALPEATEGGLHSLAQAADQRPLRAPFG